MNKIWKWLRRYHKIKYDKWIRLRERSVGYYESPSCVLLLVYKPQRGTSFYVGLNVWHCDHSFAKIRLWPLRSVASGPLATRRAIDWPDKSFTCDLYVMPFILLPHFLDWNINKHVTCHVWFNSFNIYLNYALASACFKFQLNLRHVCLRL